MSQLHVASALLALLLAPLLLATSLQAQSRISYAIDATVGGGHGHGGELRDRSLGGMRFAFSVRSASDAKIGAYAELARDWISLTMGHDAVCYLSSRGGCVLPYPELRGFELTAGVLLRPTRRVEVRTGVGGGEFHDQTSPRAGGIVGQADITLRATTHIGVVVGTRYVVIPRYQHDRLWTMPIAVGLRTRW